MAQVAGRIHAGNIYVNRNIVGAVVAVQPFGGEGLSGTGPKAGGPLYLRRLLSAVPEALPAPLSEAARTGEPIVLEGPTGESNTYRLLPRGNVLCRAATAAGFAAQWQTVKATGNTMLVLDLPAGRAGLEGLSADDRNLCRLVSQDEAEAASFQVALFEGDGDTLLEFQGWLARRDGPIVVVQGLGVDEIEAGRGYRMEGLLREVSMSVNTAAAGGNASLMMIG